MTTQTKPHPPLIVRVEGPAVAGGRILLSDLTRLGRQLQTSMDRVAMVLVGEASVRPGAKPKDVREASSLVVVAMEAGSFVLGLDFPRDQMMLGGLDPSEEVLEKLVLGLEAIPSPEPSLPPGYDEGVLLSWREVGGLLDHGIERLQFALQTRRVQRTVCFDRRVYGRVIERIQGRVQNVRTIEGRLLMADFKESATRCRIHPPFGRSVSCTFDEARRAAVLDGLLHFVRVTGEAEMDPVTGQVANLRIADLEVLDAEPEPGVSTELPSGGFWEDVNLETLVAEQDVGPVTDLEGLTGGWPDDENVDDFIHALRSWRSPDGCRST